MQKGWHSYIEEFGGSEMVEGTRIPLLVTACFDNSGFSGLVTLKSLGGSFCHIGFPHS